MTESGDLAVYIHWPYCSRICPYCDFNVYKAKGDTALVDAIRADLADWREWTGPRQITSIHFGGGTPSLLSVSDLGSIITQISTLWPLAPDCEIAIEANPKDADGSKWQDYANAGLNRLSLGVQTFNDAGLKLLGRDHNGEQAQSALDLAMNNFPSVSLDMIFGWRGQTLDSLDTDIDVALGYAPHHISTYQLTIEPGTAFGRAASRGDRRDINEDMSADFYDYVAQRLCDAGYEHYEVSNFAKAGHRSRHNMAYWTGQDYVGVGPGAHGRLTKDGTRHATIAALKPDDYVKQVNLSGLGVFDKTSLSAIEHAEEYLLMGLRITEGISLDTFDALGGKLDKSTLTVLSDDGFIKLSDDRLCATARGRRVLNYITEKLLVV